MEKTTKPNTYVKKQVHIKLTKTNQKPIRTCQSLPKTYKNTLKNYQQNLQKCTQKPLKPTKTY